MRPEQHYRQTGRTTFLLSTVPKNGYFIVHNSAMIVHADRIARNVLQRADIKIITIAQVGAGFLRGRQPLGVVADHVVYDYLTRDELYDVWMSNKLASNLEKTFIKEGK